MTVDMETDRMGARAAGSCRELSSTNERLISQIGLRSSAREREQLHRSAQLQLRRRARRYQRLLSAAGAGCEAAVEREVARHGVLVRVKIIRT